MVKEKEAEGRQRMRETERKLEEIWGRVLQLEEVGVEDNFFELGGDSLKVLHDALDAESAKLRRETSEPLMRLIFCFDGYR